MANDNDYDKKSNKEMMKYVDDFLSKSKKNGRRKLPSLVIVSGGVGWGSPLPTPPVTNHLKIVKES